MPAVPGSIRRNSVGPNARPRSRASCQPSAISARTVTIRTGRVQGRTAGRGTVDDEHAGEHRQQDQRLDPRALDRPGAQLTRQADLAPGVTVGVEELPHVLGCSCVRGVSMQQSLSFTAGVTGPHAAQTPGEAAAQKSASWRRERASPAGGRPGAAPNGRSPRRSESSRASEGRRHVLAPALAQQRPRRAQPVRPSGR